MDRTIPWVIIPTPWLSPGMARHGSERGSLGMRRYHVPTGRGKGLLQLDTSWGTLAPLAILLSLPTETTSASTSSFMPPPTTKICDKGAVVGSGAVAVCWTAGLVLAAYGVLFI